MRLFDKIKSAVMNAADNAKAVYEEAAAMDLESLCAAMKELKLIDPKLIAYRAALNNKLDAMSDQQLDAFYGWIKKQGSILKKHPAIHTSNAAHVIATIDYTQMVLKIHFLIIGTSSHGY